MAKTLKKNITSLKKDKKVKSKKSKLHQKDINNIAKKCKEVDESGKSVDTLVIEAYIIYLKEIIEELNLAPNKRKYSPHQISTALREYLDRVHGKAMQKTEEEEKPACEKKIIINFSNMIEPDK